MTSILARSLTTSPEISCYFAFSVFEKGSVRLLRLLDALVR